MVKGVAAWLRTMDPTPKRLRLRTADDETKTLEVSSSKRRWAMAEQAIRATRAVLVEALDEDDNIIDARTEGESAPAGAATVDLEKLDMQRVSAERRELAQALDAMGERAIEAYNAGARAASEQQDKLVKVIDVMLGHLTTAITNINTIAVGIAEAREEAAQPEEPDKHGVNGQQLMGLLAAGLLKDGAKP